ncbi:class I mannose-6-phosphate isomerase [Bacteroides sp. ET71]|uniref:class I mannose-6-phosphate isomerase n=1 Tax=Bacteroides sp. ET71 TaxID=2939421 RepID=UPI002011E974|nr:class I mannose-6-phosphate isomerase [Bacteroides sp. ET71]MCL1617394.1 class I mannose-6-phosphate isomerase [Bacteroides sp. ET71]
MRTSNYDKYPATVVENGYILTGWNEILAVLSQGEKVLAVDLYTGVLEDEVIGQLKKLQPALLIDTRQLMKPEEEILEMTSRFMTDDVLFGYLSNLRLEDYFDISRLEEARRQIGEENGKVIVVGTGAGWVTQGMETTLVYADMARWEIQQRFRRHEVKALGVDNRAEAPSLQYKRGYFNDWNVCDRYKDGLFARVDYWLDTNKAGEPKMIDGKTFMQGIENTVAKPFRVVPFFDPAPWGGQWMKEVCDLNREEVNFGWCFDCVPEENSLLFNIEGVLFELPSNDLVLLKSRELLGAPVEARFGKNFPIRFDFLDTMGGGNLSLQVHPTTQFVHDNFGIHYTQDESYYLLDAEENASVYLGLRKGIRKEEMAEDLRKAQNGNFVFDAEKYVNKFPAKKHDHFLIPGGTVHCSGAGGMVLEISSTPNLFTFKMWDWQRLGLDGKPRPINVERGLKVIDWERDMDFVNAQLRNQTKEVASGDGWVEEHTGLHENEFIETRRHWFKKPVTHCTNRSVNVLNLVEGDEVTVSSPVDAFEPFVVHYAETFIIPACVGEYTITPGNAEEGKTYATIKAYVRF